MLGNVNCCDFVGCVVSIFEAVLRSFMQYLVNGFRMWVVLGQIEEKSIEI